MHGPNHLEVARGNLATESLRLQIVASSEVSDVFMKAMEVFPFIRCTKDDFVMQIQSYDRNYRKKIKVRKIKE